MTFIEIINATARNLGLLASDNTTFIEGAITLNGLKDEINRVYKNIVLQQLLAKNQDDFAVEARQNTYRDTFTISSIDSVNLTLTSTTGVFGNTDVDSRIYNAIHDEYLTITGYISPTQIRIDKAPTNAWTSDVAYILSNILVLDGDLADLKEVISLGLKYENTEERWKNAQQVTLTNFNDISNVLPSTNSLSVANPVFCVTTIKINDNMQRVVRYFPYPTKYNGTVRITYSQLPNLLESDDQEPLLENTGVSELLINGATAWGWKVLNDPNKASLYEENNPELGGVVPKGFTLVNSKYKPSRNAKTQYKGFRR